MRKLLNSTRVGIRTSIVDSVENSLRNDIWASIDVNTDGDVIAVCDLVYRELKTKEELNA